MASPVKPQCYSNTCILIHNLKLWFLKGRKCYHPNYHLLFTITTTPVIVLVEYILYKTHCVCLVLLHFFTLAPGWSPLCTMPQKDAKVMSHSASDCTSFMIIG